MTLVILLFRSTLLSLINLTKEMQMSKRLSAVLAGLVVLTASANAAELNAYSIMPEKYASQIFAEFTKDTGIKEVAVAGGVSANNGLRNAFREHAGKYGWKIFIPKFSYTTDNAAMIAITGHFKYQDHDFCTIDVPAYSRVTLK